MTHAIASTEGSGRRTALITGAAGGIGLELTRIALEVNRWLWKPRLM